MGNGPMFTLFLNNDLPLFTDYIDRFEKEIEEEDVKIKSKISESMLRAKISANKKHSKEKLNEGAVSHLDGATSPEVMAGVDQEDSCEPNEPRITRKRASMSTTKYQQYTSEIQQKSKTKKHINCNMKY